MQIGATRLDQLEPLPVGICMGVTQIDAEKNEIVQLRINQSGPVGLSVMMSANYRPSPTGWIVCDCNCALVLHIKVDS